MATSRKPDKYVTLGLTDDVPILPATVKKMLDEIPTFSDIVEMSITAEVRSLLATSRSTTALQCHGRPSNAPEDRP